MMLNIKLAELQKSYSNVTPIALLFSCIFIFEILFLFKSEHIFLNIYNESSIFFLSEYLNTSILKLKFDDTFILYPNVKTVATALFSSYLFSFLISSYVLLLAMVAAIILTVQKNFISKNQDIYSQLMANHKKLVMYE
jgi:NADH:ubiquinone oxidoreductase subunit 6 (subunit J)